jgi:hypothetical protein
MGPLDWLAAFCHAMNALARHLCCDSDARRIARAGAAFKSTRIKCSKRRMTSDAKGLC